MGPLKRVNIHAVLRSFDFSRQTGTSLGQNQWLYLKPKKLTVSPNRRNPTTRRPAISRKKMCDASNRRNERNHESKTSILQTLLPNSLSRLCYSPMKWGDLLLGMGLTLPKGPQDSCPEPWPCGKKLARLRPINSVQDYFKSTKQATESGRLDDSNQRPDSSAKSI